MATPLTKAQWKKRKDRGHMSYDEYVSWWMSSPKRNKLIPATTGYDPTGGAQFAPATDAQLRQQAATYINSIINPVLARIKSTYADRSRDSTANIRGYTTFLQNRLNPIAGQVQQEYTSQQNEQRGIDAALTSFLTQAGMTGANNLGASLDAIGQTGAPSAPTVNALTDLGSGLAAAATATGSSTMSRLAAQRASDVAYARELPGLAGLTGMQNQRRMEASLNQQMGDELGALTDQVPGLTQTFYQSLLDREFDKAVARQGFLSDERNLQTGSAAAAAEPLPGQGIFNEKASREAHFYVDNRGNFILDAQGNRIPYNPPEDAPSTSTGPASLAKRIGDSALGVAQGLFNSTTKRKDKFGRVTESKTPVPNQRAYAQVYAYVANNMPGATPQQVWAVAQKALVAAGYIKASQIPDYYTWATQRQTDVPSAPPQTRPGVKPAPPPGRRGPSPSPDTQDAAAAAGRESTTDRAVAAKAKKDKEKKDAADRQSRESVALADRVAVAAHKGGADRAETVRRITAQLKQAGVEAGRAAAIARSAVARAWG